MKIEKNGRRSSNNERKERGEKGESCLGIVGRAGLTQKQRNKSKGMNQTARRG